MLKSIASLCVVFVFIATAPMGILTIFKHLLVSSLSRVSVLFCSSDL
jgi:hypothetical protein